MKKVEAYKCDYCSKASINAGAIGRHEKYCKKNPNNQHKCFDYCRHLQLSWGASGNHRSDFVCKKTGNIMYSFKAESRGFDVKGLIRMPLECEHHEYMTYEEQQKRFDL